MSASMSRSKRILPFVLATAILPLLTSATCYWQNSTLAPNDRYSIATDDTACFPNQANSPCCGTGWSCLSDGVCYIQIKNQDYYYRGTCTDRTWGSQECPGWCFAQNNSTSIPLAKCKKSTGEDWYCCPGDPDCNCDSGRNAIKLGATQPVTATVIGSTSWPGYQSTSTASAGKIASSGTTTTTAAGQATSTTATSAGALNTTTAPSPVSDSKPGSNNTALAAGLGAGIGAVVLILGAGALFLFQRSRKRRAAIAVTDNPYPPSVGAQYHNVNSHPVTPHAGQGYYATSVVNEKDGKGTFGTQELPTHQAQGRTYGNGVSEMDGNAQPRTVGRTELA